PTSDAQTAALHGALPIFNRNLTSSEIIGQLWWAKRVLEADAGTARLGGAGNDDTRVVSNVVMMGMGEPLLNYDQLLPALRLMLEDRKSTRLNSSHVKISY